MNPSNPKESPIITARRKIESHWPNLRYQGALASVQKPSPNFILIYKNLSGHEILIEYDCVTGGFKDVQDLSSEKNYKPATYPGLEK
jgi:hypothetical protein